MSSWQHPPQPRPRRRAWPFWLAFVFIGLLIGSSLTNGISNTAALHVKPNLCPTQGC